jgi:predicted GIY-YIG superfamily endonuclease
MANVRNLIICKSNDTPSIISFKNRINNRYGPGFNVNIRKFENLHTHLAHAICNFRFLSTVKAYGIIPKGLRIKLNFFSNKADSIIKHAMMSLVNERLHFHRYRKYKLIRELNELKNFLINNMEFSDFSKIYNSILKKQYKLMRLIKDKHDCKLSKLLEEEKYNKSTYSSKPSMPVHNLSKFALTQTQSDVLGKGLNFALCNREVPILDIIASVETGIKDLSEEEKNEVRCMVNLELGKKRNIQPNITQQEYNALKDLRQNKELTIRKADKGGGIVLLDSDDYDTKMQDILASDDYSLLNKDPTSQIERKVYKTLVKYKHLIPDKVRTRLTPHYSKVPHIYGLPKVHKEGVPLRPIVSSRFGPLYELSRFLLPIITPYSENSKYTVKDSKDFVRILKHNGMDNNDIMVSFDIVNLFPSVPTKLTLEIVKEKLEGDPSLSSRTYLTVEGILELLEVCLNSVYFQYKDNYYSQKTGLPMGSSLSPALANIFMDWMEDRLFNSSINRPKLWLRYVDDTFVIWQHGLDELHKFFDYINNMIPSIKFTLELENNNCLPFLDVLVVRGDKGINTTVYRKPTHKGMYINKNSNHPDYVKRGVIKTLYTRAKNICSDDRYLSEEISNIVQEFSRNGYSKRYVNNTLAKIKRDNVNNKDEMKGSLIIPYIKGTSERIKRIAAKYGLRTAFHSRTTLRNILCKTNPNNNIKLESKNVIYSLPCECGKRYLGETGRPLGVRLAEHKKNVKEGKTNISKLAEHVWEEHHKVLWDNIEIVGRESNRLKRKIVEASFMAVDDNCISQASKDVSTIWRRNIREYLEKRRK